MGAPFSPPGGPGSPDGFPVIPGESPYDLDRFGTIDDPTDWQLWWMFNRDRFLRFDGIHTGATFTGSDGFYLGSGQQQAEAVGGRANDRQIDGQIATSLLAALKKGGSNEMCQSTLVAMSKIGGEKSDQFEFVTQWFIGNGTPEMNPVGAFVTGMNGNHTKVEMLREIALNTVKGCEFCSADGQPTTARIPMSTRAFAAYGLGMIGSRSSDMAVRREIVKTLIQVLEDDSNEANDARVAAMVALGLVPLSVDPDVVACYCGTCVVPDPYTSLRPQVTYLMRYFTAQKEFDPTLRAHAATTLARLVAARPDGMTDRMKEGVAEVLVRALDRSNRQPREVRESAVLGLGLIGDADNDNLDRWIRWAVKRSLRSGEDMEKRFALIAMGEIGGHKGQGDEPWAALAEVRGVLTKELGSGRKRVKPWAALALGVMGHELRGKGVELDPMVDAALGGSVRSAKKLNDLGAYALAIGMRRNGAEADRLVSKLSKTRDEAARGYVAIALGMVGAKQATELLQDTLADAKGLPLLQTRAGVALGLLGDDSVADSMLAALDEAIRAKRESVDYDEAVRGTNYVDEDAAVLAAISALGYLGDSRGIDKLCEIVVDAEEAYPMAAREAAAEALGYIGDRTLRPWRVAMTMGANYCASTKTLTTPEGTGVLDLK